MNVKRLLFLSLLILPLLAFSQVQSTKSVYLSKDSLWKFMRYDWQFHMGDSMQWAASDYDDADWETAATTLYITTNSKKDFHNFNGICWMRLRFTADTSIVGFPLALAMTHLGASEVYFDGKKINFFGVINGPDSTENEDPAYMPFTFVIPSVGEHVFAVRYANYAARYNFERYGKSFAGFRIRLGSANDMIINDRYQAIGISGAMMVLFGIFIALSLLHLFLFLYHRAAISNLYFTLFTCALAFVFLMPLLNRFTPDPTLENHNTITIQYLYALGCFALSGFNNDLFSRKKLRFRIITALCILFPVLGTFNAEWSMNLFVILLLLVVIESVVLIIVAMYRKVKGARIIGAGVLFFTLFILGMFILAATIGSFDDSKPSGRIVEFVAVAAILSLPVSMSVYLAWSFAGINKDLKDQLNQVKVLSKLTLEQEQEKKLLLENRKVELEKEVDARTAEVMAQKEEIELQHEELKIEKKKSDDLLRNILPEEIADELKQFGTSEAKYYDHVTVLFTDFVNFTSAGERLTPQELVDELHNCFKAFDDIISKYDIEKIKTIGDAYLAVKGLPAIVPDHAKTMAKAAIEIRDFMAARKAQLGDRTFDVRIGLHSGSVVAGIVGVRKFAYDIWGDTVNTAARMEQNSETGKINVSQVTYDLIKDDFNCTYRGEITAKNKGAMSMYFIESAINKYG